MLHMVAGQLGWRECVNLPVLEVANFLVVKKKAYQLLWHFVLLKTTGTSPWSIKATACEVHIILVIWHGQIQRSSGPGCSQPGHDHSGHLAPPPSVLHASAKRWESASALFGK